MITVLASGPVVSVQDLGRPGQRALGVGIAGAMDPHAFRLGNILAGNPETAAGIEIAASAFSARFEEDAWFALTGGDCAATLDGMPVLPWWTMRARKGQVLSMQPPRDAAFAYLVLAGGVDVEPVFGSRSTDQKGRFGGVGGRALQMGDVLQTANSELRHNASDWNDRGFGLSPRFRPMPEEETPVVRVLIAAEHDALTAASRQSFWESIWTVQKDSSRVGYRLGGPRLELKAPMELFSHGILPGVVQLPPSGQPAVQMADANTCGGYPKIGVVIAADLGRFAQLRPGRQVRFECVSQEQAVSAARDQQAYLRRVEQYVALARMMRPAG